MRHMNQWLALATAIEKEIAEFPEGHPPKAGTVSPQDLVARERYKGEDVDAAVHSFSTSGRWPLLESDEYYFIGLRLKFGRLVARALAAPDPHGASADDTSFPQPNADFSMDIQLQWLLNAAWGSSGRAEWAAGITSGAS
jgi:hypothetical protein